MKFTLALVAICAPCLAYANVGLDWIFADCPPEGLTGMTFPMSVAAAKHEEGYYFAQEFSFHGVRHGGYIGLQPRPDRDGRSMIHAAFSSFQDGTTMLGGNCINSADGGPGVSCWIDVEDWDQKYHLVVHNIGGATWQGLLLGAATGLGYEIGAWTLPAKAGKIKCFGTGFVEYYPWNHRALDCPNQPRTSVTFYNPFSNMSGASGGVVQNVHDYGDCQGLEDLQMTLFNDGYHISYGREDSTTTTSIKPSVQRPTDIAGAWEKCGGKFWTGPTACAEGYFCSFHSNWYSQCTPSKQY